MKGKPLPHEFGAERLSADGEEDREIQRIALYAFLINIALMGIKIVLTYSSASLAVAASAIDSATDAAASLAVIGGLKLSTYKTATFPYGLYKVENVISVVVAIFIFVAGYEVATRAFSPAEQLPVITPGIIGWLVAGALVNLVFGQYVMRVGRRTGSPALRAEGRHRQVDLISSSVVVVAVALSYVGLKIDIHGITIDHIGAAVVVIFIAYAGYELLSDGMRVLLDASIDPVTMKQVRQIIESEPTVREVRWLTGRNAGRYRFIDSFIVMRTGDLSKAHAISDRIERMIREQVPHVERVVIHYEPQAPREMVLAVPLADMRGRISSHLGESPYFAIVRLRLADGKIDRQEVIANPHTAVQRAKGIRVAEWLVDQKVDAVAMREDVGKKGPGYVFADAGIEVHLSREENLDQLLASFSHLGKSVKHGEHSQGKDGPLRRPKARN